MRESVPEARQGGTVFSAQGSGERVATTFGSTACEIVIQSPTIDCVRVTYKCNIKLLYAKTIFEGLVKVDFWLKRAKRP